MKLSLEASVVSPTEPIVDDPSDAGSVKWFKKQKNEVKRQNHKQSGYKIGKTVL